MTGLVSAIDHLVLTVRDIDAAVDFYARALGIEAVTFGAAAEPGVRLDGTASAGTALNHDPQCPDFFR